MVHKFHMEKYLVARESGEVSTAPVAASDLTHQQNAPENEIHIENREREECSDIAGQVGPSKTLQQDSVSADPWPYLKDFVTFVKTDGPETIVYKCNLCPLSEKNISLKKSRWSLTNHFRAKHFHALEKFKEACEQGSKIRRKRSNQQVDDCLSCSQPKLSRQTKIVDSINKGGVVTKAEYEKKVRYKTLLRLESFLNEKKN